MKMNKKGFTLIELLAVIVVLAIIMVLATTTVLPLMTTARKKLFLDEAEAAIQTAANVMSLKELGQVTLPAQGNEYRISTSGTNTTTCFTLYTLQQTGLYSIDGSKVKSGGTGEYAGWIKVTQQAGTNRYTYQVRMHNSNFFIGGTGSNGRDRSELIDKNVVDYTTSLSGWTC